MPLKTLLDEQVSHTPPSPIASPLVSPSIEASVQTPARPSVRPFGSPPGRRTITRYAFEFFQDQIETLKGFSLEEKLRGEKGSMSEMIREATDAYIAQLRRAEEI